MELDKVLKISQMNLKSTGTNFLAKFASDRWTAKDCKLL